MALLLLSVLLALTQCWPNPLNNILQMSTTNETLLVRLPTFSDATVTTSIEGVTIIDPVNITYTMNGTEIIQMYHYIGDAAYWAPTQDGLLLFCLEQNITTNYSGLVLYYDAEANEQFRTVILYNITDQNTIQFDVAAPAFDNKTNQLLIIVYQTLTFNFTSQELNDYVFGCQNLTILYVGGTNYTLFCEFGGNFSVWAIPTFENDGQVFSYDADVYDNNTLNISQALSIESALVNPQLYFGVANTQLLWSVMFSSNNVVYLCSNSVNSTIGTPTFGCGPVADVQGQIINILSMVADYYLPETFVHTSNSLYMLENQNNLIKVMDLNNSDYVFVTRHYVYVEIVQSNYTNVTIYDRQTLEEVGQLILGSNAFVVENDMIITSAPGGINIMLFSPYFMMIEADAPYIQNVTSPLPIGINISTPYSPPQLYNYTLYLSPFNQTLFSINPVNSSDQQLQFTSYMDLVVVDITKYLYVLGPLVHMEVEAVLGQYNANIVTGLTLFLNISQLDGEFNWQVLTSGASQTSAPPTLTFQNHAEVVTLRTATGQIIRKQFNPVGLIKTFVDDNMVYLVFSNGQVQNCTLQYTNCQQLLNLQTTLSDDSSKEMLIFKSYKQKVYFALLNQQKLQLMVRSHNSGSTRMLSMPANELPPINEIIIVSLDQGNFGRIAILSTSNNVTIVVANVSASSQYPSLVFGYNITLNCSGYNSSQMQLQPFDEVMITYCYNQSFVTEYLISNTQSALLRLIPLYAFTTASFANFTNTMNYYFVPVTLLKNMPPYFNGSTYRLAMHFGSTSCSSIKQIVNTSRPIIVVGNIVDTIIYTISDTQAVFMDFTEQVYIQTDVVTADYTPDDQYPVLFGVSSLFNYNYLQTIMFNFNLSSANISYGLQPTNYTIFFCEVNQTSSPNITDEAISWDQVAYFGEYFLNLATVMGTIQDFQVQNTSAGSGQLPPTIHKIDLIQPNKLIGEVGDYFTSLIELNPLEYPILRNTTLSNLILAVSRDDLYIMEKIGANNYDLNILNITTIDQPSTSDCTIHLYQVQNNTAATFLLFCGLTQLSFNSYPYPILTLNYSIGQSFSLAWGQINIPLMLIDIEVIPNNNTSVDPFIVGLLPQSGNTASQTMVICNTTNYSYFMNTQNRTTYVSVNFDVLAGYQQWIVASINMVDLNFWWNPVPQPDNTPVNVTCNISIENLKGVTHQNEVIFLDLISVINSSITMLVGGFQHYYLVTFVMQNGSISGLTLLNRFRKYYECNGYDQFKPQIIYGNPIVLENSLPNISSIIIYCTQNRTALNYVSSHNLSSDQPIYTSYVQIFVLLPNGSETPIRVVQSDASDTGCVLAVYKGVNFTNSLDSMPGTTSNNVSSFKLIYQQIGGVLVDNRLKDVMGFVVRTNQPPIYNFSMVLSNSYFSTQFSLTTYLELPPVSIVGKSLPYIIIMAIYNLLALVMIGVYCYRQREKSAIQLPQAKSESQDGDLKAYYNRLHEGTKNRAKQRIYELEQFQ